MERQEWEDQLITPDTNLLTYIKKGVLWIQKKPFYIVELVKEANSAFVMVYKVHPSTDEKAEPKKLAVEQVTQQHKFSQDTLLGQLANRLIPNRKGKKWVAKPPVFIAPVLPNRMNTFTGKWEAGFFERGEDRVIVQGGEKKYIRGENTGVFIGLSSITWEDKVTIPTESLVAVLTQYKQSDDFFDLSGNNNDTSNPLSQFYRGGK